MKITYFVVDQCLIGFDDVTIDKYNVFFYIHVLIERKERRDAKKVICVSPLKMPGRGWHEPFAGTVAGISGLSIMFPLDTIKCRLQTRPAEYNNSAILVVRRMVQKEGLLSLYRGLLSPALGYGAINSTVFGVQSAGSKALKGNNPGRKLALWEELAVGANAGLFSGIVRTPIERVKTVMQIRNSSVTKAPYSNSLVCAADLLRTDGLRTGLFEGLGSTIAREVPQYLFYFVVYEKMKAALKPRIGEVPSQAIAGGTAGAFTWLPPIFCIDVVKTKLQSAPVGTYSGMIDCFKISLKQEGWPVFFRGTGIALMRAFPLHGTIFVVYEGVMNILRST